MITLDKRGRRIILRSPQRITGLQTTVPGAYQSVSGPWSVPLSIESLQLLKMKFGKPNLKLSTELQRWVSGVQQARKYMKNLAKQDDAHLEHLPRLAPRLAKAMRTRTYQRVGARFIADNSAAGIFDDPGLGKTLICLGGILESETEGPYLIIAPKTASESVWKREIERWLPPEHRVITMPQYRYQRERALAETHFGPRTWLVIHPEMVQVQAWWECACGTRTESGQKQLKVLACGHERTKKMKEQIEPRFPALFDIEWGAVVIDESQDSLIRRSGKPTQRRRGMDMLVSRNDGLRIAMSGTPFDSKPHQLWGTLNWLDPVQYSAFHRWSELYWNKGGFTGFEIGEFRQDREKMLWDSLSAISIRRTKAEVAQDLPPKMEIGTPLDPTDEDSPVGIWLPMDGKQEKAYRDMEELSMAELESGRLEAITALAELTRLKQLACSYGDITEKEVRARCETDPCLDCIENGYHWETRYLYHPTLPSNKFDWTIEHLEEWGYPDKPLTKVVIVSFYTGILNMFGKGIEKHFKKEGLCTAITGQTPGKDRRRIIDQFNSKSGPQIMLLNVKAGGTAITLDTADRMIFISETRIPDQQKQAEDRIHRVSNPRQCMYYYLRSLGTVDVGTAIMNKQAIKDSHRLLDQRRGVSYMRQVLDLSQPI